MACTDRECRTGSILLPLENPMTLNGAADGVWNRECRDSARNIAE